MGPAQQMAKSHRITQKMLRWRYENFKLTRPKNTAIFVLADISIFKDDISAHKFLARILEASFCVFFNSLHPSRHRINDESIPLALP